MTRAKIKQVVVGCQEYIGIPSLGVKKLLAKVDTGAYTGALHCDELKIVRQSGQKLLQFRPIDSTHKLYKLHDYRILKVKSASGHVSNRYIIPVHLELHGVEYETHIGLTQRHNMKRQMLIGRNFLRQNDILVDVSINQELDDEREIVHDEIKEVSEKS